MSSSLAVLLEVKTTYSSAVLSFHLSQCFTPPLKSIPASFFPHTPCPPSWIPSLPTILTPVLRMCRLFKTTYPALGACLSTDPIWWGNFLMRGKSLKGGRTRRISSESGRFSSRLECEASMWLLADGLVPFSDGVCAFVSLIVCCYKTRKTILRLLYWEGSKPPGSDHTRTEAKTTCVPKTSVQTTYVST